MSNKLTDMQLVLLSAASQRDEGWILHRNRYDDGGFSGGSMDRPALQKLLEDVRQGRIDVVVVYKIDRLTRSLADFAKLVELFDARGASLRPLAGLQDNQNNHKQ